MIKMGTLGVAEMERVLTTWPLASVTLHMVRIWLKLETSRMEGMIHNLRLSIVLEKSLPNCQCMMTDQLMGQSAKTA